MDPIYREKVSEAIKLMNLQTQSTEYNMVNVAQTKNKLKLASLASLEPTGIGSIGIACLLNAFSLSFYFVNQDVRSIISDKHDIHYLILDDDLATIVVYFGFYLYYEFSDMSDCCGVDCDECFCQECCGENCEVCDNCNIM